MIKITLLGFLAIAHASNSFQPSTFSSRLKTKINVVNAVLLDDDLGHVSSTSSSPLTIVDSRASTPLVLQKSVPSMEKLNPIRNSLLTLSYEDGETDVSARSSSSSASSRKVNDVRSLKDLRALVDMSETSVLDRLRTFLAFNNPRAFFYELYGNPGAANLSLFSRILPDLVRKADLGRIDNPNSFDARYTVLAAFEAFLFHNVPIHLEPELISSASIFHDCFAKLERPFVAFYVLTQDFSAFKWFQNDLSANLFTVDRAILMLPESMQIKMINQLFSALPSAILNKKLHVKLFRDAQSTRVCDLLIQKYRFNPLNHHECYRNAKLPREHAKWAYFESIYGTSVIYDGYLNTDQMIKPQMQSKHRLPMELYSVAEREWRMYNQAYGFRFVSKFHSLRLNEKSIK